MKKIRKNNKGFTLVELIIVIAILGILTVAVAPQYLKYVEKSREASDLNAINEVLGAMSVIAADPASTGISDGKITMNCSSGTMVLTDGTGNDATGIPALVANVITLPKIQSTDGKALTAVQIDVNLTGAGVSLHSATALDTLRS